MTWLITLLSIVVAAGGFIILHFALTERTAELRVAGWVLVIGSVVNTFLIFYFQEPKEEHVSPTYYVIPSVWHEQSLSISD